MIDEMLGPEIADELGHCDRDRLEIGIIRNNERPLWLKARRGHARAGCGSENQSGGSATRDR